MPLIQVLGPGCPRCDRVYENARAAAAQTGGRSTVERVTDMDQITSFEVMMTPALVIDGVVKVVGRVPTAGEIAAWLAEGDKSNYRPQSSPFSDRTGR